jgi:hypothetical protein
MIKTIKRKFKKFAQIFTGKPEIKRRKRVTRKEVVKNA